MKLKIKSWKPILGDETRIEIKTEAGSWQQPQAVNLQPTFAPNQTASGFSHVILPNRGVPFSPLND